MREKADLVIFTGAGASKPLGYPLANEFFKNEPPGPIYSWLLKLFDPTPQLDVEDALSILDQVKSFADSEAGRYVMSFPIGQQLRSLFMEMNSYMEQVKDRCFDFYGSTRDQDDVDKLYLPLFDLFRLQQDRRRMDFFTTNYDPVSDSVLRLLETLQIDWTDGFDRLGTWTPREFDEEKYAVRLFRLHGSMCYHRDKTTDEIRNTRFFGRTTGPENARPEHLIIYPGYKGNPEKQNNVISTPHRFLKESLQSASLVIVIGFAFRDEWINRAFVESKEKTKELRIVIVNPASEDEVRKNLPREIEQFDHVMESFGSDGMIERLSKVLGLWNLTH